MVAPPTRIVEHNQPISQNPTSFTSDPNDMTIPPTPCPTDWIDYDSLAPSFHQQTFTTSSNSLRRRRSDAPPPERCFKDLLASRDWEKATRDENPAVELRQRQNPSHSFFPLPAKPFEKVTVKEPSLRRFRANAVSYSTFPRNLVTHVQEIEPDVELPLTRNIVSQPSQPPQQPPQQTTAPTRTPFPILPSLRDPYFHHIHPHNLATPQSDLRVRFTTLPARQSDEHHRLQNLVQSMNLPPSHFSPPSSQSSPSPSSTTTTAPTSPPLDPVHPAQLRFPSIASLLNSTDVDPLEPRTRPTLPSIRTILTEENLRMNSDVFERQAEGLMRSPPPSYESIVTGGSGEGGETGNGEGVNLGIRAWIGGMAGIFGGGTQAQQDERGRSRARERRRLPLDRDQ